MPRYAILEHDHPHRHWDLLLEAGDVLRTWRLSDEPAAGQTIAAEATFDHRLVYLDYEGPISGGRGSVVQWDAGTFTWVKDESDQIIVQLAGKRLQGTAHLQRDHEVSTFRIE